MLILWCSSLPLEMTVLKGARTGLFCLWVTRKLYLFLWIMTQPCCLSIILLDAKGGCVTRAAACPTSPLMPKYTAMGHALRLWADRRSSRYANTCRACLLFPAELRPFVGHGGSRRVLQLFCPLLSHPFWGVCILSPSRAEFGDWRQQTEHRAMVKQSSVLPSLHKQKSHWKQSDIESNDWNIYMCTYKKMEYYCFSSTLPWF